jgi:hypothetical protein
MIMMFWFYGGRGSSGDEILIATSEKAMSSLRPEAQFSTNIDGQDFAD